VRKGFLKSMPTSRMLAIQITRIKVKQHQREDATAVGPFSKQ
jgi:hypothetical protein